MACDRTVFFERRRKIHDRMLQVSKLQMEITDMRIAQYNLSMRVAGKAPELITHEDFKDGS